jgi:hypothetical protein
MAARTPRGTAPFQLTITESSPSAMLVNPDAAFALTSCSVALRICSAAATSGAWRSMRARSAGEM